MRYTQQNKHGVSAVHLRCKLRGQHKNTNVKKGVKTNLHNCNPDSGSMSRGVGYGLPLEVVAEGLSLDADPESGSNGSRTENKNKMLWSSLI